MDGKVKSIIGIAHKSLHNQDCVISNRKKMLPEISECKQAIPRREAQMSNKYIF